MNGFTDKCSDCKYFEFRDVPENIRNSSTYCKPDGFCSKIFPRGYIGAGKPGGYMYSNKQRCFQFDPKASQISIFDYNILKE